MQINSKPQQLKPNIAIAAHHPQHRRSTPAWLRVYAHSRYRLNTMMQLWMQIQSELNTSSKKNKQTQITTDHLMNAQRHQPLQQWLEVQLSGCPGKQEHKRLRRWGAALLQKQVAGAYWNCLQTLTCRNHLQHNLKSATTCLRSLYVIMIASSSNPETSMALRSPMAPTILLLFPQLHPKDIPKSTTMTMMMMMMNL